MNKLVFTMAVCAAVASAAGGTQWEMLPIDGGGYVMNVVFTRNPQVAYMTIDVGGPYRSDDGLKTWRPLHGAMPYDMKRNFFTSPRSLSADPRDENSIVVAAGNNARHPAGIIVSRDGGKTWKQTAVGNYLANARRRWMGQLLDRNPWNPDELVTGGDCTGLMKSTDNGETWRPVGNLRDRWFSCVFYDRTVKGRVWACAPGYEDVPGEAKSVADGREPNPVPRCGRTRGLYRSDDGGETWTEFLPERIPEELCQIAGDPRIVGIFEEQRILGSVDGGATWTDFSQGLDKLPKGVNVWDNYGCQRGVYKAIGAGSDFLLVSDTRGNVFRRRKGEDAWREVKAKAQALTHPEREMRDASHKPAACSVIVDPRDDRHWLVTDWYTVWESIDAGETWHTRIAGAQQLVAFTVAASPFDPNVIFYATADSRMYVSADGGRSFAKVKGEGQVSESVNSVAFSRVTPGLALVTGGKFNPCVRVTRDDGRTWKVCAMKGLPPIKPDLGWTKKDGFYAPYAIAVHPKRDEFYLAMGGWTGEGKGGVYRSTDAGETWEWFGQGLGEHQEFFKFQEWGNGKSLAVSESGDLMCWDMGGQDVYRRGSGDAAWSKVAFSMRAKDGASGLNVSPEVKAVPGKPGWFFANCGPDDAALYCSTDGGRTFAKQWPMTGLFWTLALDASAPGTMLAVGCGDVFVSRDYGASFSVLPGGFNNPCGHEPALFMDRGRIWAIGGGSGCWTRRLEKPAVAESEIPKAVAEKVQKTEFKVNVRQEWVRNLLGDNYDRYVGWPTLTRLRNGELVAVFSGDREGHVCPYGKVMLIRSQDGGESWTKPEVVCDGPIDDRDAGLLELANGDLVLFWFTSLAFIEYKSYYEKHPEYLEIGRKMPDELKRQSLGSWARRSVDGGRTWSEPVRVPVMTPHGGRQLRDGRILVIGKHNSQTAGILRGDEVQAPSYFAAAESTDGGRSFREIGRIGQEGIRDHWSLAEPSFVEALDGTLTAYFRYELAPDGTWSNEKVYPRYMYRSVSRDGGRTWTNMERSELDGFPPHFLDLGGDRVLATYGSRTPGRTGVYAAFSSDGGKTFDAARECCIYRTPFEDCGYPSTVRLDDGSFLSVFYAYPVKGRPAALVGTKWRFQDRVAAADPRQATFHYELVREAPTVRKANGDFPVFRAGDRVAWIGDSIASNGHRTPSGYINAVRTAAEATGTPGFDNIIGLGFGGWHVYGWHAYERKSLTDPSLPSRCDRVPTMGDVFTNRLDVIVLALGINDHGFPTFPNDDLKIWQDEYDRFISDLEERCRPRRLVICNTTAHTCDPEAATNRRLERMNVLIRELAEKHDAVHVDMHAAIWRTIDRVRQMKTGLRDLQDFIHPRAVGNAAMARQFCLDIGETKMAEWLSGELERRYAAMDARAGDKPRLVCRLRPDRAGNVTGCSCMNYDILWNLNGADRASVGVCVPEGWRTSVIRQTQSNGVIRVCGRPDRLTNRVTVTADLAGRVLEEVVDIPAPWLISPDFAFVSAWKDMEWQRKAAPPVDVKEVRGWKVHTQTWDYAGDNDPSAIDLRAVNTGYPNGAAYVRRWLYAPRALKLKLVVGTQFWSACNAVRVWLDGKVVAETVLRSGWVDGKPYSCDDKTYPIVLEPGWHDLTALTANRMFDHYFHIRILDAETGKEPSELRIGCGLAD